MHVVATPVHGSRAAVGRSYIVIGCGVITPIPHIHVLPGSLLTLLLVGPFDSGLLSQPKGDCLGHLPHLLVSVIETTQETAIFYSTFDALVILVDEVEATDLFFLASQPA
jgi:hypothetical protein